MYRHAGKHHMVLVVTIPWRSATTFNVAGVPEDQAVYVGRHFVKWQLVYDMMRIIF
jgi:hypothetical protein